MTFLDAAREILKQAGHPLYHAEITRRALEQGLIETAGQTPEATMSARLSVRVAEVVSLCEAGLLAQVEE